MCPRRNKKPYVCSAPCTYIHLLQISSKLGLVLAWTVTDAYMYISSSTARHILASWGSVDQICLLSFWVSYSDRHRRTTMILPVIAMFTLCFTNSVYGELPWIHLLNFFSRFLSYYLTLVFDVNYVIYVSIFLFFFFSVLAIIVCGMGQLRKSGVCQQCANSFISGFCSEFCSRTYHLSFFPYGVFRIVFYT